MNLNYLLISFLTVLSAILGAVIIFIIRLNHKKLCTLISFSAGALFGAAVFVLIPESLKVINIIEGSIGITSGYLLFGLLTRYYSHVCPACSASHFDERTSQKFSEISRALIIALSIHCFLDGIAISSEVEINKSLFFAVFTHKFPEGLALASLMISGGFSKFKVLIYVLGVEMITVIGSISGNTLLNSFITSSLWSLITAHISGGFIFLASHAVLGEMLKNHSRLVIISFALGTILILLISKFVH